MYANVNCPTLGLGDTTRQALWEPCKSWNILSYFFEVFKFDLGLTAGCCSLWRGFPSSVTFFITGVLCPQFRYLCPVVVG